MLAPHAAALVAKLDQPDPAVRASAVRALAMLGAEAVGAQAAPVLLCTAPHPAPIQV